MPDSLIIQYNTLKYEKHPPYQDPNLQANLSRCFRSADGQFAAAYWHVQSPGQLLETPDADELICILEGSAIVEREGRRETAKAGDTIVWLKDQPAVITIPAELKAFCVVYKDDKKSAS